VFITITIVSAIMLERHVLEDAMV